MPKVTVIVPNYNHARYLPRRLQSVLGQTFRDTEVLFLDDASADDSRAVFSHYATDPRVRAIFNEHNSGNTFKQWNLGLEEAKGEYIWIAESDDDAEPSLLAELVARLDANPNVGLAYCRSRLIDADGAVFPSNSLAPGGTNPERWSADYVNDGRDECERYLIYENTIPNASAVLLRHSIVDRVGPAPEAFKLAGDWIMWARMLMTADVAYVAEPLNAFRKHAQTVRHKVERSPREIEEFATIQLEIARRLRLASVRRKEIAEVLAWRWLGCIELDSGRHMQSVRRHLTIFGLIVAIHWRGAWVVSLHWIRQFLRGLGLERPARALLRVITRRTAVGPPAP